MPNNDGTGPRGMGLRRGRGFGPHACWKCPFRSDPKKCLSEYKKRLEEELEDINKEEELLNKS